MVPTTRTRRTIAPKSARTSQAISLNRARVPLELMREREPSTMALARAGFASVQDLFDMVAAQFQLPRIALDDANLGPELASFVPEALARKHRIVPVLASPQQITIAVSDPTQLAIFDWLGREHKRAITTAIATPLEIERAQARLYETARARVTPGDPSVDQDSIVTATRIVNALITGAVEQRASDIHVEATERETVIRYRVDGALRQVDARPIELHAAIVSRIKVIANLDIAIHHAPQDGRIKLPWPTGEIDLRVSTLPTYWGEKVVLRILDNRRAAQSLDALGFDATQKATFLKMVRSPYGLVLVTGPTGSGKSTTLYSALSTVRDPELNVVTVEDPVEYQIGGINQVQVAPKRGLTFANALRSILRQDPDVILVGEIRDQETGSLAAEAALTGHLVLSSLHTNDAVSTITRLVELGIEPHLVAPSLLGIVSQRLMRTVCRHCAELYVPQREELETLGLTSIPAGTRVAKPRGCSACHNTGYSGRVAIREILEIDEAMRAMISRKASVDEIRAAAVANGFESMRVRAMRLWLAGATSTRELIRVTRSS